tara:strand:+ start:3027 stop:3275 length:249 start_codon:yes stop_codon:yes gene_type:complete
LWVRNLNASWHVNDNDKDAYIKINYNDVLSKIVLNKSVSLELIYENENINNYKSNIKNIVKYRNNIKEVIPFIIERKPKKLW